MATLIAKGAKIDQADTTFNSTPIGWAVHTLTSNDSGNLYNQLARIKLLLKAGANKELLDAYSLQYLQDVATNDLGLRTLLNK